MNSPSNRVLLQTFLLLAVVGCDPVPVQYPPGTYPYPSNSSSQPTSNTSNPGLSNNPAQSQIDKERRWAHAADTAQKAAFIGGLFGGPYGAPASMGLGALGFLYGMITADAQIAEENAQAQAQYRTEATKDQQLEAAIEQELEKQRALENKISTTSTSSSGSAPATRPGIQPNQTQPPVRQDVLQQNKQPENVTVASLGKPVAPPPPPSPFKNVEIRDTNGDGIPDLWIYYNPQKPGEIVRQEEATKGNGNVDTWSYFKDGKLVRREVDSKGQGRADNFFYYDNEKIVREEHDETGQGRITYRAFYQSGRIAKVEKDTTNNGRPDLWIYYDTTRDGEVMTKEERDLNGDGIVDLWTYFENGRMVRRDLSAVGLELLTQQEKLPVPTADIKPIAAPGS
jgi:hypothetical protein